MKKIILGLLSLVLVANTSIAQDKAARAGKGKAEVNQNAAAEAGPKMKKDGTPDKRYKENKMDANKPATPMKKDGTPDKRYKANKEAAK